MKWLLVLIGVVIAVIAIFHGFMSGELKRIMDDPVVKENRERAKRERDRQETWKKKINGED